MLAEFIGMARLALGAMASSGMANPGAIRFLD